MRSGLSTAVLSLCLLGCVTIPRAPAVAGLAPDDRGDSFSAVWIGHATLLLRFGDRVLLTDPNLNDRILFYPRATRSPVQARELPPVDVVLLSHLHLDHFDAPTLHALGPRPTVLVPHDGASYRDDFEQEDVRFPATWETTVIDGLRITSVPARHTGGRYGFDFFTNHAYTGWVIEGAGHSVYFAGDTGYDPSIFKEIGRRFPHLEVAFIPIAPTRNDTLDSKDRWGHVGPSLALQILADTGAQAMVPIHFQTFYSRGAKLDEPAAVLLAKARERGVSDRVVVLQPGERLSSGAGGLHVFDAALIARIRGGQADGHDGRLALRKPGGAR